MGGRHDRASGSRALRSASRPPLARSAAPLAPPSSDVLSDVLRTGKLTGALFFLVDAAQPWEVAVPQTTTFAPLILPRAQHVISYHVVTQGSCWGALIGEPAVPLAAGDILVFPHGDAYVMSSPRSER